VNRSLPVYVGNDSRVDKETLKQNNHKENNLLGSHVDSNKKLETKLYVYELKNSLHRLLVFFPNPRHTHIAADHTRPLEKLDMLTLLQKGGGIEQGHGVEAAGCVNDRGLGRSRNFR
jgi:hypothetical protein